jgi:hypothetical protein
MDEKPARSRLCALYLRRRQCVVWQTNLDGGIRWLYGPSRRPIAGLFMASEEDLAAYYAAVLPKLVEVGATGAMLWCFADYSSDLWNEPPCDEARHERFFGMVRPDGTLKPHAEVIRQFAATHPTVIPATRPVTLDCSEQELYQDPSAHMKRLFATFAGSDRFKS